MLWQLRYDKVLMIFTLKMNCIHVYIVLFVMMLTVSFVVCSLDFHIWLSFLSLFLGMILSNHRLSNKCNIVQIVLFVMMLTMFLLLFVFYIAVSHTHIYIYTHTHIYIYMCVWTYIRLKIKPNSVRIRF